MKLFYKWIVSLRGAYFATWQSRLLPLLLFSGWPRCARHDFKAAGWPRSLRSLAMTYLILFFITANAETFRNHAVTLPSVGYMVSDLFPEVLKQDAWPITNHIFIGTGYRYAFKYDWWVLVDTQLGFGKLDYIGAPDKNSVISLNISSGVRHDFLINAFRPFGAIYINYLQFFVRNDNNVTIPINFGPKLSLGLEWIFYEDMSLQAELAYSFLFNLDDPIRQNIRTNIAYVIYF